MNKEKTVGILLAGGHSTRYGEPKAFAVWQGKYFYEWTYRILAAICDEVLIVTKKSLQAYFPKNHFTITDHENFVGCGPLAGIFSAMEIKQAKKYIVLPCDMPLLNKEIIYKLVQNHEGQVTVVQTGEYLQPLVSIWDYSAKQKIYQSLIKKEYKIKTVLEELNVQIIPSTFLTPHDDQFMNINTKDEERRLENWNLS